MRGTRLRRRAGMNLAPDFRLGGVVVDVIAGDGHCAAVAQQFLGARDLCCVTSTSAVSASEMKHID